MRRSICRTLHDGRVPPPQVQRRGRGTSGQGKMAPAWLGATHQHVQPARLAPGHLRVLQAEDPAWLWPLHRFGPRTIPVPLSLSRARWAGKLLGSKVNLNNPVKELFS